MIKLPKGCRMSPEQSSTGESSASAKRLVIMVCAAQVLVQIGAFFWPTLLPRLMTLWNLSYSEAGWITSAFYAAYILAVPGLVTLTDRFDPKIIYLSGVSLTVAGHFVFGLFVALVHGALWAALGVGCADQRAAMRTECGQATSIMRLSTCAPSAISPCWRATSRARRRGPISAL